MPDALVAWGLLAWLCAAWCAGRAAKSKGHSFADPFIAGLLFSPVVGLLYAAALPDLLARSVGATSDPAQRTTLPTIHAKKRPCPHCGERFVRPGETCGNCGK